MGLDSTVNFCNYICPKLAGGVWQGINIFSYQNKGNQFKLYLTKAKLHRTVHIRVLGVGLELACNGGSCGEYHLIEIKTESTLRSSSNEWTKT